MLILCDFDGTVTAIDTNSYLARLYAPGAQKRVEGKLATRELTLREVLGAELAEMTAGEQAIVATAVADIPFRPHFGRFVAEARQRGDRLVVLSAGFRQVIEPMLAASGVDLTGVELVANDVDFTPGGGVVTWRELPVCDSCGEQCKRGDVARLRAELAGEGAGDATVVYIGDGFSDRCAAETADRIFARDALARYLDRLGVGYEPFDDFGDIATALADDSSGMRGQS